MERAYRITCEPDWASPKAFAFDFSFTKNLRKRVFFPKSAIVVQDDIRYLKDWIVRAKKDELSKEGFDTEEICLELSSFLSRTDVIEVGAERPEPKVVNAASLLAAFDAAAENLQYPKLVVELEDVGRVKVKRAGKRSIHVGCLFIDDGKAWGDETRRYFGKVDLEGNFHPGRDCPQSVIDFVTHASEDLAGFAGQQGRQIGACCFCSKELTDSRSTEVGYGPTCAGHYGLPWG